MSTFKTRSIFTFRKRLSKLESILPWMALALTFSACNDFSVYQNGLDKTMSVVSFDKLAVESGEVVTVAGKNLSEDIKIELNGVVIQFVVTSKTKGSFIVPIDAKQGLSDVKFVNGTTSLASIPLVIGSEDAAIPIMTADAKVVCNDIIFKDKDGKLTRG